MKPRLVPEWKRILRKAWSARLMFVAAIFGLVETLLPYFSDSMPRGLFSVLTVIATLAALVARIVAQKGMGDAE